MRIILRPLTGATILALTALVGVGAGTARAQVGYYVVPSPSYPRYYGYSAPARNYVYTRPAARNRGNWGSRSHYGYYPARRGLPLYKPWLRRD